jgi:hypothetical protein
MKPVFLSDNAQVVVCEHDYDPFDPLEYLREYYACLGPENQALLRFFDRTHAHIFRHGQRATMHEFGGGPTIYQLISAARYNLTIDVSDYLEVNLQELVKWLKDQPDQFHWDAFVAHALRLEGGRHDPAAVQQRAALLRTKVNRLLRCDARLDWPLTTAERRCYDIVSANFVLEAITGDVAQWRRMLDNVMQLVATNGYFILSTVIGAKSYRVGERFYPATPLSPSMVLTELQQAGCTVLLTHEVDAEQGGHQGYTGIFMAMAQRCGTE